LFVVVLIMWFLRRLASGTFIAGGLHRHRRLAILDAAAVDTKRRLVLVRRDNHEHLLLIGGATDIVVERNINNRDASQSRHDDDSRGTDAPDSPAAQSHLPSAGSGGPAAKAADPNRVAASDNVASLTEAKTHEPAKTAVRTPPSPSTVTGSQPSYRPAASRAESSGQPENPPERPGAAPQSAQKERPRPVDAPRETSTAAETNTADRQPDSTSSTEKENSDKPKALEDEMERLLQELSSGR
jgi:flagellar biogenesis protein FliO